MIRRITLIIYLVCASLLSNAQKAYEIVHYRGKIKGQTMTLSLANGYITASQVAVRSTTKSKSVVYSVDTAPDDNKKLSFKSSQSKTNYFVLNNMQDAYDEPPATITGVYISGKKATKIKLRSLKVSEWALSYKY